MPIPYRERFFNSDRLEDQRRHRTDQLLGLVENLPGYTELDRLIFERVVEDLVICEMHVRDLDRRIVDDPDQWLRLDKVRASAAVRLGKLRSTLLKKVEELTVTSAVAPRSILDALV